MHFILVAMGVFAAPAKGSGLAGHPTVQRIKYCVISAQQSCTWADLQAFFTRCEAIKISHEVGNEPVSLLSIIIALLVSFTAKGESASHPVSSENDRDSVPAGWRPSTVGNAFLRRFPPSWRKCSMRMIWHTVARSQRKMRMNSTTPQMHSISLKKNLAQLIIVSGWRWTASNHQQDFLS